MHYAPNQTSKAPRRILRQKSNFKCITRKQSTNRPILAYTFHRMRFICIMNSVRTIYFNQMDFFLYLTLNVSVVATC